MQHSQLLKNISQNEKSRIDLQNQLRNMSLEQLQNIHSLLCQGGQIVKTSDVTNHPAITMGTLESL